MPIVSPSPEELHAYQDEELAAEELLTDELRRYPTFAPAYKTQYIYVGPMRFEEYIVGHHYLSDEAEELGILCCRHLLEHYENFATGFSSQSLLFIYVGFTYWSTNTIIASPRQSSIWISGMLDCLVKFKCSSLMISDLYITPCSPILSRVSRNDHRLPFSFLSEIIIFLIKIWPRAIWYFIVFAKHHLLSIFSSCHVSRFP